MSKTKRFTIYFFIFISLLNINVTIHANDHINEDKINITANYIMSKTPTPTVSSTYGEWALLGIMRSGIDASTEYYDIYLNNVINTLDSSNGNLGRKYSEYSRIALALNEAGYDPKNVGNNNYNLFSYINDYDKVIMQGINGPIYALTAKYYCNDNNTESEQKYINYIIEKQNKNGSFGLSNDEEDTDITAMAISALALYSEYDDRIDRAINKAFLYLSSIQMDSGGFSQNPNEYEENCESICQVIIAMKRFGLNQSDKFFTKNGNTPLSALDNFRRPDGGYIHMMGETTNDQMSTEQALQALVEPQNRTKTLIYDNIWFNANIKYMSNY